MEKKDFYVYLHKLNDGTVFYVGQGSKYRPHSPHSRNVRWNEITSNNSYIVEIVQKDLTEKESLDLEKELILKYGRLDNNNGSLINHNNGGIGLKGEDNYFYNKHLYGNDNGNFGNKYSKNPLSKPVLMLNKNGKVIQRFSSSREAEELYGYISSCITNCCLGKRQLHKNNLFIYEHEYDENKDYKYIPSKTSKQPVVSANRTREGLFEFIKSYDSSQDVATDGYNSKVVNACTNGDKKTHKNLYWFKIDSLPDEVKEYIYTNKI
jgi:hypothetical protein